MYSHEKQKSLKEPALRLRPVMIDRIPLKTKYVGNQQLFKKAHLLYFRTDLRVWTSHMKRANAGVLKNCATI
jgi:hypothetical protein